MPSRYQIPSGKERPLLCLIAYLRISVEGSLVFGGQLFLGAVGPRCCCRRTVERALASLVAKTVFDPVRVAAPLMRMTD